MDYKVVPRIHIEKNRCRSIGEFLYDPQIDGLYFEGKYPFPVQLLISESLTKCRVTPMFLRLPFILRGWINLDILLREISLIKLLFQDKLLLHASCVDDTLIVGFPNSGKTYMTFKGLRAGYPLISEEYTIIDNGVASAYKKTARSCLSLDTCTKWNIHLTGKERCKLGLNWIRATLMPFMFEAAIWKEIPVSGKVAKVKRIIFGSTGREVRDWKELAILTDNEFPFVSNDFLAAYAVIANLDIITLQEKQRQLIKEFVDAIRTNSKS